MNETTINAAVPLKSWRILTEFLEEFASQVNDFEDPITQADEEWKSAPKFLKETGRGYQRFVQDDKSIVRYASKITVKGFQPLWIGKLLIEINRNLSGNPKSKTQDIYPDLITI